MASGAASVPSEVLVEDLTPCASRLQDEELAVLGADIQLAVGQHRRGLLDRAQIFVHSCLPVVGIEGGEDRAVVDLVERSPSTTGDENPPWNPCVEPLHLLLADVAPERGGVDGGDQAHLAGVEVLLAVRHDTRSCPCSTAPVLIPRLLSS